MSNSAAQTVADKSVALAVAIARQKGQVRDSRIPTYSRELLGGNSPDDCAEDVASLVLGVKKVTSGPEVCHLVLSALYVAYHTESLTKAHVKMSPGSAPGVPAVRAVSSAQRTAEVTVITSKIDLAGNVKAKDAIPKVTIEDASAILAMAVYAAGKAPSDTNKAGFLGEDGGIRGRAGTLRDAFGAHPEYVTGVRSLDLDDLKKISRAFSSNPGARHALFGPVALALVRPITVAEQIVSSQARLLRSEGMGSFERAITAVGTYGPALDVLSLFRADMEALARTMAAVASETYVMQTFGFILDRDAYDTVRVGNFVKLAQLGVLVAQKAGGSTTRIQPATPNLDIQAKVKAAFDLLEAA